MKVRQVPEAKIDLVEAVKQYALDHYGESGWDVVVESMEDIEIADEIKYRRTEAGAIRQIAKKVGAVASYREDIIGAGVGTALDVPCSACKAAAGEGCVTPTGNAAKEMHKARVESFGASQ